MSWWKKLWPASQASGPPEVVQRVRFSISGWEEREPSGRMRVWSGSHGSVLSLSALGKGEWPATPTESEAQHQARLLAMDRGGGLIEAETLTCSMGTAVCLIYKRLQMPAYVYTGMFIVPARGGFLVWTIVAGECGTTGVREAVVTAELMNAGRFGIQEYERLWARDPYDPTYAGVDRSVLRFISDDESYDNRFPEHPLSRVRQVMAEVRNWIQSNPQAGRQNLGKE